MRALVVALLVTGAGPDLTVDCKPSVVGDVPLGLRCEYAVGGTRFSLFLSKTKGEIALNVESLQAGDTVSLQSSPPKGPHTVTFTRGKVLRYVCLEDGSVVTSFQACRSGPRGF